jgi:hypothetical protein
MKKEDIVEMLNWMSTRFQPQGYEWLDCETDKTYTSEEVMELYISENEL